MNEESRKYLKRISSKKTPPFKGGSWANDTHEEICYAYTRMRNYAKESKESKEEFDDLLNKYRNGGSNGKGGNA